VSAVPAASGTPGATGAAAPSALLLLRDDGPLARAIGAVLGRALALPPIVTIAAAGAPSIALMAAEGDNASRTAVGAALAWLIVAGAASRAQAHRGRLRWAVPPLLRLFEYAALLWIGALAGESSQPAAFALLAVLTFRHYDLVYRPRHQGVAPPQWVGDIAGGWDGRLLLGYILLVAGALPAGLFIAAGLFATVFVAESIAGWRRYEPADQHATYDDEED
jgi:uncharacterized protein DUF5941